MNVLIVLLALLGMAAVGMLYFAIKLTEYNALEEEIPTDYVYWYEITEWDDSITEFDKLGKVPFGYSWRFMRKDMNKGTASKMMMDNGVMHAGIEVAAHEEYHAMLIIGE